MFYWDSVKGIGLWHPLLAMSGGSPTPLLMVHPMCWMPSRNSEMILLTITSLVIHAVF